MIIYALIIIAILFFLSWNLIEDRRIHFIASLITTALFIVAIIMATANFGFHYGMHRVSEPVHNSRFRSLAPQNSIKMLTYRPMGNQRSSQVVAYRNVNNKVSHTDPDANVTNRIVRSSGVAKPHFTTRASKWTYRNAWSRRWFGLAKKPSVYKVQHVFYVPNSWHVLSYKQSLAFQQIVKNQGLRLKHQMNSTNAKLQMKQRASLFVKARLSQAMQRDPKLSEGKKKMVMKRAVRDFKVRAQQKAQKQVITDALRTSATIH